MTNNDPSIQLFNECNTSIPINTDTLIDLTRIVEQGENCSYLLIEAVMVTPSRIIELNREYLDRDYVTDIITFRYDVEENYQDIEGTLFCCWDRIQEQATEFGEKSRRELIRVIIHGLLHLAGYGDQTEQTRFLMTEKEDHYLRKFEFH